MNKSLVVLMIGTVLLAWMISPPMQALRQAGIPADAECAECGMSIADTRFSARITVVEGGGTRTLYFDDVGCAFDYERWNPGLFVRSRAFAVSGEPRWLAEDAVRFVLDPKIATPMGTGILTVDGAEAVRRRAKGDRVEAAAGAAEYRKQ